MGGACSRGICAGGIARGSGCICAFNPWKLTRGNTAAKTFADEEIRASANLGRPIIIFFDSDHDDPVPWPKHALVFRFSIYSDTRGAGEFSIPTFSQDFLALNYDGVLKVREKQAVPSVGFCGYAPPVGCRISKRSLREVARYVAYRAKLLGSRRRLVAPRSSRVGSSRALQRTDGVDARFIVRDQFAFNQWGVLQPGGTAETAARQRREFIENLNNTDYARLRTGTGDTAPSAAMKPLALGAFPFS